MQNETMTAGYLCIREGISPDQMRYKLKKNYPALKYSAKMVLTSEQVEALLSGKKPAKKQEPISEKTGEVRTRKETKKEERTSEIRDLAPAKKWFLFSFLSSITLPKFRAFSFAALCSAAVIGHAGLVWFDCWELWGKPGAIGGALAFILILIAFILSTESSKNRTSQYALLIAFLIDAATWKVHYETFLKYAQTSEFVTGCLCAFLPACSWAALYLFRDYRLE